MSKPIVDRLTKPIVDRLTKPIVDRLTKPIVDRLSKLIVDTKKQPSTMSFSLKKKYFDPLWFPP